MQITARVVFGVKTGIEAISNKHVTICRIKVI